MNWSLSKYGTFKKCPAQYKYKYVDKLPYPSGPAASRGIEIHKDIENYLLEGTKPIGNGPLDSYWAWLDHLRTLKVEVELQLACLDNWEICDWNDPSAWLKSVFDALVVQGVEGHLFDWKTGKIYDDHVDQKELYTILTFKKYPELKQIKAIHVYLDYGKNTEKTYHRDEADWLIKKWNIKVHPMLSATEFIPTPNYGCRWCPYSKVMGGPCQF